MSSRVVFVVGKGGPEVLRVQTRPLPEPSRGQVRIRVHRAGVAFGDVMRRRGVFAPPWRFTPGYDVAGTVESLGSAVETVPLGARVAAMMPGPGLGGYADHVCVSRARLVMLPPTVSDDDAMALGLNYITARQLIERFVGMEPGQSALVHGAAGGVGTALLDLGQQAGLTLFGTASGPKHAHLRARGCEPIDYRSEDFVARIAELTEDGVDAVFDGLGGAHLTLSHRALSPGGMLVAFGVSGDLARGLGGVLSGLASYTRLKLTADGKRVGMYNINLSRGTSPKHCRDDWQDLLEMASNGALTPAIGAVVPLEEVQQAHRMIDEAAVPGKLLLNCE